MKLLKSCPGFSGFDFKAINAEEPTITEENSEERDFLQLLGRFRIEIPKHRLASISYNEKFRIRSRHHGISVICPSGPSTFYYGSPITQTSPRCTWTFKVTINHFWCIGLVPEAFWKKEKFLLEATKGGDEENVRVIGFKNNGTYGGVLVEADMHDKKVTVTIGNVNGKKILSFKFIGAVHESPGREPKKFFEIPEDYGYPLKLGFCGFSGTKIKFRMNRDHVVYFLFVSLNNKELFGRIPRELRCVIARVLWLL